MNGLQQQHMQQQLAMEAEGVTRNEVLDRENHSVVEILTQAEFKALQSCWPGTNVFALRFTICSKNKNLVNVYDNDTKIAATYIISSSSKATCNDDGVSEPCEGINFCTPICRSCDATGRQCSISIKNRSRNWVKKSSESSRAPASLEY